MTVTRPSLRDEAARTLPGARQLSCLPAWGPEGPGLTLQGSPLPAAGCGGRSSGRLPGIPNGSQLSPWPAPFVFLVIPGDTGGGCS